jgi:predicted DCC family thiol-disulfide oxidoreductase YuxK
MRQTRAPIIFFDGVCNLCSGYVDLLIKLKGSAAEFKIASLQGETAAKLLPADILQSLKLSGPSSVVVLLQDGRVLKTFTAIQQIAHYLRFPLNYLARLLLWLISPLGERSYSFVAAHRYQWFGKKSTCRLPTPTERAFFLP